MQNEKKELQQLIERIKLELKHANRGNHTVPPLSSAEIKDIRNNQERFHQASSKIQKVTDVSSSRALSPSPSGRRTPTRC